VFAHNKTGIAYQDKSRRPETGVNHKTPPANCLTCRSCFMKALTVTLTCSGLRDSGRAVLTT
jgi:hypothetical protein